MLDSERYLSLSSAEARLLFVELILLADDYGLLPAGWMYVARRTSVGMGKPRAAIETMLQELADADLIRLYTTDCDGQKLSTVHAYIPRFGNSPRSRKPMHPVPPDELGGNEIKHLREICIARAQHMRSTRTAYAPETETETETETVNTSIHGSANTPRDAPADGPDGGSLKSEDWHPGEAGVATAREAGMDDATVTAQIAAFAEWHTEAGTAPTRVTALWRAWVRYWQQHRTPPARDEASLTAAYLAAQAQHRAQATSPPPAVLALRSRRRTTQ